ncbi:MAG: PhzF family phenazine biosynthesis protein [Hyphomicrobiales bacterium]
MQIKLHQVVTFARHIFHGNPAFVATASEIPRDADATMAGVSDLIGADVMALILRPESNEPELRFYTPDGTHPGAGHATAAAAFIALSGTKRDAVAFKLANGDHRHANRSPHGISVRWPVMPYEQTPRADDVARSLRARPSEIYVAPFGYVAFFEDEQAIVALEPDLAQVAALDRSAVIATAPGTQSDIVIRVFAPAVGLPEDPVCGTAHRIITPYWAPRLGKSEIHSRHLSKRGGDLWCKHDGTNVEIAGEAIQAFETTLNLPAA